MDPERDIELTSHKPAKVHLEIRLLLRQFIPPSLRPHLDLSLPLPSRSRPHPSFPSPLELTVIDSGRVASRPFVLTDRPLLRLALPDAGTITPRPSGVSFWRGYHGRKHLRGWRWEPRSTANPPRRLRGRMEGSVCWFLWKAKWGCRSAASFHTKTTDILHSLS